MKTISKFIINRNNLEYYYVEKCIENKEIFYYVHFDQKTKVKYNQDSFHAIFGIDEKLSIQKYIMRIMYSEESYFDLENHNKKYQILNSINKKISMDKNKKNPKISIPELLCGIALSNKTIPENNEIDHTEAYNIVMAKKPTKNGYIKDSTTYIEPLLMEQQKEAEIKGMERVKKYDN